MGPRTEHSLLPPESARAIYQTIENATTASNEKFDSQGRALEKIQDGVDAIKDQLRDGRVTFAEHKGMIDTLDARVGDVESDIHKLVPQRKPASPTGLHPSIAKTPVASQALTDRREKPLISPKLINAFLLAAAAAVGTGFGGLLMARMAASQFGGMIKDAVKEERAKDDVVTPAPTPTIFWEPKSGEPEPTHVPTVPKP